MTAVGEGTSRIKPTIGRIVTYRSRTGQYDVPAMVTATTETLRPEGVAAWEKSDGKAGVPPLSSEDHVHLTVLTPGVPGQRAAADDFLVEPPHGRSENVAGCYQEWDIPLNDEPADPDAPAVAPGTWRWPERA